MKLKRIWVNGFKNLNDFELDLSQNIGLSVLIGNNGSGKSNVLEAMSAIFTGLFKLSTPQRKPTFEYEIEYELNEIAYKVTLKRRGNDDLVYSFFENNSQVQKREFEIDIIDKLPDNLIALYSGEELRLWDTYYRHLYSDFMTEIRGAFQGLPSPRLMYLNKDYWNISLLTLLYSTLDNNIEFCKKLLKIDSLDDVTIRFNFNQDNLTNFTENSIVNFVKSLNSDDGESITIGIQSLRDNQLVSGERELFLKLMAAVMDKQSRYKLIENITINFGNDLTTESLSEGEKKQILLRSALEILATPNSLILFDEPDSHIHVANKGQIKSMLDEYENRETILTTHSPTLMHKFDSQLIYLDKGEVQGNEKLEILKAISGNSMSYTEQQILLNSDHDILLVEGKTDVEYIKVALEKLKDEYLGLNFGYIPFGGTDQLQHFIGQFEPKDGQTIIALLDRDPAGGKALKQVFGAQRDINSFSFESLQNMYVAVYPKKDGYTNDRFLVEDYFHGPIIDDMAKEIIENHTDSFSGYPNIAKQIKNNLPTKCKKFDKEEFAGFRKLFDLIVNIKTSNEVVT